MAVEDRLLSHWTATHVLLKREFAHMLLEQKNLEGWLKLFIQFISGTST